jgi:hypothetical protein
MPSEWGGKVAAALLAGEAPVCWLEIDLTQDLLYGKALLLLTERRFLVLPSLPKAAADTWDRSAIAGIRCGDQLGVG